MRAAQYSAVRNIKSELRQVIAGWVLTIADKQKWPFDSGLGESYSAILHNADLSNMTAKKMYNIHTQAK